MPDDFMREEILYQKDILLSCFQHPYTASITLQDYAEIWFTGSGDSHCASLFGSALGSFLGLPTRALTPMNASYFMNHTRKLSILLLAISVSGKTPRVLEVVKKVTKNYAKHKTIGLTDNPHSILAQTADESIILQASPSEVLESSDYKDGVAKLYTGYHHDVAQTKTYFANVLAIIALIKRDFYTNTISLEVFENWLVYAETLANQYPVKFPQKTIFIGAGLTESLAQFGQYKWFEYTFPGLKQDIEEYAHTHYFTTDEQTTLVFFAPAGPVLNRALELITGALGELIKPQMIVMTDTDIKLDYDVTIINVLEGKELLTTLPVIDRQIWYYLFSLVMLEWYTYHTARNNGFDTNKFRGGAEGEKYVRGSYQTIRKSKIND